MHSGNRKRYYRCYFLKNDHIVAVEEIHSHDDVEAIDKAQASLAKTESLTAELWRGRERIAAIDEKGPSLAKQELDMSRDFDPS